MKAILLSLLFGGALAAQPASMEGTVVNNSDGQPLSGSHISLILTDAGAQESFGALSDRNGHFSVIGIAPGTYLLIAGRTGYLAVEKPGGPGFTTIRLKAGQQLTGYTVKMALHAVIAGRILDEAGDPISGINVVASHTPGEPVPPGMQGKSAATTDDRGAFRLVIPAGKYYVQAMPPDAGTEGAPEIRTDGSAEVIYGETYYPNSANADGAAPIDAAAGHDVTGIEMRLVRRQSLNVIGTVTGPAGPVAATVWLRSKRTNRSTSSAANGRFSFSRLEPGTYQLYAQSSGKPSFQSQWVNLRVEGSDQNNVQLLLSSGGDLSGIVDLAGAPLPGQHTVHLEPIGQVAGAASWISGGAVDGVGSFDLSSVPPGRYRVTINPMPDDTYFKGVLLDGIAARGATLDLTRGARSAKLAISLGRGAGRLSGTVRDDSGDPSAGEWGVVLLVADGDATEPAITNVTPEGKYSFQGVRPGKYRVAALDLASFSGTLESEAVKQVAAGGEPVEIGEGGRIDKDLKLLTKEAVDAKR